MLFNPHSDRSLLKLRQALTGSIGQLKIFTKLRKEAYEFYCGKHYSDAGKRTPVPMNMIEQAVSIILRSLISSEPQALIATTKDEFQADAFSFELALNRRLCEMDFGKSLKEWSFEALMCPFGILKIALDAQDATEAEGIQMWTGPPMAAPVFFDDWVHDMSANCIEKIGFCGNRYEVVKSDALSNGLYDPDVVARIGTVLKENDDSTRTITGDPKHEDYRETFEVWDIWIPDEGLVVTISRDFEQLPPLRVVEWDGPYEGPYHLLQFNPIPGTTIPLPPVALWRDIHELSNKLFNKLGRQALRQKDLVTVPNAAVKDGKLIVAGQDGEAIVVDDPNAVKQVKFGGPDQTNFAFVLQLKQLYSYYAGNLDALGGLAPMSGTVGQDELLSQAASQRIRSMQEDVDKAAAKAIRAIGWFYWNDQLASVPINKPYGTSGATIPSVWERAASKGEWYDYDVQIVPHSLRRKPPEERLNFVMQFFTNVLMPALPVMQAQGIAPNMEQLIKLVSRLANMPELNDLVTYMNGEMVPNESGARPPSTSAQRVVKANGSTKTPQGQEQQLIAKLMSGTPTGEAA